MSDGHVLKEMGLVTKVECGIAWVNTQSKLSCSTCQVESTCGNAILEKFLAGKIFISKLNNSLAAQVGDQVVISIPKSSVSKASLVVYGVPLLGMIGGALFGDFWFNFEPFSILFSAIGLALGLIFIHFYNQKIANTEQYMPTMVSILSRLPNSTGLDETQFSGIQVKNIE